jgi:hypothetical protein
MAGAVMYTVQEQYYILFRSSTIYCSGAVLHTVQDQYRILFKSSTAYCSGAAVYTVQEQYCILFRSTTAYCYRSVKMLKTLYELKVCNYYKDCTGLGMWYEWKTRNDY